jgi:hypothetical protein
LENSRHHVTPNHRANGVGIGAVANSPKGLGGAPLEHRIRTLERLEQRRSRGSVAYQPEGKRCHLPHFDLLVSKQARQRLDAVRQAHASNGECRAASRTRLGIAQQANEVRWRQGRNNLGK